MNQNKLLAVFMVVNVVVGQHRFSGFVNFSSANRLNDASLIRLPYRIAGTTWDFATDNYSIYGDLAMEYYLRSDLDFMNDRNTQEFSWDLRELFFQFYRGNTEFRIGKQIHSWGMVDESSPVDVVNAYDYYYLFNSGVERKLGSWSLSTETYLSNFVIKTVFSPFHQTNRLPVIDGAPDPEFGFNFPIVPNSRQFMNVENPVEGGMTISQSFSHVDLQYSFFTGYDRIFNLSGINVFAKVPNANDPSSVYIDLVFGYRKTFVHGIGFTYFLGGLTMRSDFGYFSTSDQNESVNRSNPVFDITAEGDTIVLHPYPYFGDSGTEFPIEFRESAEYTQLNIQLEYDLPWDIQFFGQYFENNILEYQAGELGINDPICMTNLCIDPEEFKPENIFTPGMGAPTGALSDQSIMLNLEKSFFDNRLSVGTGGLFDIDNKLEISGTMTAVMIDYEIEENLEIKVGLTRINGDNDHPDGKHYQFNEMEDFSNIRMQLEYRF